MTHRHIARTRGAAVAACILAVGLSGCSGEAKPEDAIDSITLLPQSLFPGGGNVTECPTVADDAPADTVGAPKAVCMTVVNDGSDPATYTVAVSLVDRDDFAQILGQATLVTPPIAPGEEGAVAVAIPGGERVLDEFAEGQQEAQETQGFFKNDDVAIKVDSLVRTPV